MMAARVRPDRCLRTRAGRALAAGVARPSRRRVVRAGASMRHRRVGERRVVVPVWDGRSGRLLRTGRAARQRWTTLAAVVSAGGPGGGWPCCAVGGRGRCRVSGSSYATLIDSRPSLLAHWRLGEMSGTTASDTTGRYNGAYTGGPTYRPSRARSPATPTPRSGSTAQPARSPSRRSAAPSTSASKDGRTSSHRGVTNDTLYGDIGTVRILVRYPPTSHATAYASVWLNGTEYALEPNDDRPTNVNTGCTGSSPGTPTCSRSTATASRSRSAPICRPTAPAKLDGAIGARGALPAHGTHRRGRHLRPARCRTAMSSPITGGVERPGASMLSYNETVLDEAVCFPTGASASQRSNRRR